jgi:GntR family transcriptional regulator / MocR family aminotransferase
MIALTPVLNDSISTPLYIQLFSYIRDAILGHDISPGDKLPSLRALSKTLNLSLTTVELAYNQLLVEGYINSKPQSGYYVNSIPSEPNMRPVSKALSFEVINSVPSPWDSFSKLPYYDVSCFDFGKWKKCSNKILTDYSIFSCKRVTLEERLHCVMKSQNTSIKPEG